MHARTGESQLFGWMHCIKLIETVGYSRWEWRIVMRSDDFNCTFCLCKDMQWDKEWVCSVLINSNALAERTQYRLTFNIECWTTGINWEIIAQIIAPKADVVYFCVDDEPTWRILYHFTHRRHTSHRCNPRTYYIHLVQHMSMQYGISVWERFIHDAYSAPSK